jgi:MinD-like ATPase involved in chromosome partitioning or flagellar assembly
MLICFWSPKGGSGTSVVAAATALVLARESSVRLADLGGDQPGIFGIADPGTGLRDWLRLGPEAPVDAFERIAVDAAPRVSLLPAGAVEVASALPEAGAALGVALAHDPRPTVVDAGTLLPGAVPPAVQALLEVADASVIVVRGCYLALRRAVRLEATAGAAGAVLLHESGRPLGARDVADVLGVPVLASVEVRGSTARAVDAGVLPARLPESLARPMCNLLRRVGGGGRERAA